MSLKTIREAALKITTEGDQQFVRTLKDINASLNSADAKLKMVEAQFGKNSTAVQALTAKHQALTDKLTTQQERTARLRSELEAISTEYGEASIEAEKHRTKIINSEAAEKQLENQIKKTSEELKKQSSGFADTAAKCEKMGKSLESAGEKIQNLGKKATAYVTVPLTAAALASVKLASDMQETAAKIKITFGDNAKYVQNWAKSSIEAMGLAEQTALDAAALYGDMGKGMGLAADEGMKMSMSLVQLSADMASFKNVSQDRVQTALAAVYTGETEALKSLGIVMTEANLKTFAMSQGIQKNVSDMTQAEKVQLRYAYVMKVTADAQGDFQRTGGNAANQARMLQEQIKQLGGEIGQELLPVARDLLVEANGFLKKLRDMNPETKKAIINTAAFAAAVGPTLTVVGSLTKGVGGLLRNIGSLSSSIAGAGGLNAVLTGTAGTVGLVGGALVIAAAGIATLITEYRNATADARELDTAMKDTARSIEDAGKSYNDSTASIQATADIAQSYINRLKELETQGLNTAASQAEYKAIVTELNTLIPDLNVQIDEQSGFIKGGTAALEKNTAAWKANAIAQAAQKYATEKINALTEAEIKNGEAKVKLTRKTAELSQTEKEMAALMPKIIEASRYTKEGWDDLTESEKKLAIANTGLGDEWDALFTKSLNLGIGIDALNEQIPLNEAQITKLKEEYGITDEAITGVLETIASGVPILGQATDSMGQKIEEFAGKVVNSFEKMSEGSKLTYDEIVTNLQSNIDAMTGWSDNMAELARRGVDEGVLAELEKLGPEGRVMVANLVNATDEELWKLNFIWWQAIVAARTAGSNIGEGLAGGMRDSIGEIKRAAKELADAAIVPTKRRLEEESPSKVFKRIGKYVSKGFALGIEGNLNPVIAASDKMAMAAVPRDIIPFPTRYGGSEITGGNVSNVSNNNSRTMNVTQNITNISPEPLSEAETARQNRLALQQAAMLWGGAK